MRSDHGRFSRALDAVERIGNRLPDPVLIFLWMILAVVVISVVGAAAGWDAVNPVNQQPIRATSLLSSANLERLLVEMPRTLTGFAPLGYVLLVMLGAGIAEQTGLAGAAMRAAVGNAPKSWLTPIVVFASVMANQAGDAAFVVMIPLSGALFAAAGLRLIVGIAAAFAGVAGGFSANLLRASSTRCCSASRSRRRIPAGPSEASMNIAGNWYFITALLVICLPIGWFMTDEIVGPRLGSGHRRRAQVHDVGNED